MKFEWDSKKEQMNIKKRKVTFEQASYVFSDPFSLSMYDPDHSEDEDRYILIGKSQNEVILTVVHTFRDSNGLEIVRVISARKATKKENKTYQKRCPR
jgi:uncharacterized DUF497 family protein